MRRFFTKYYQLSATFLSSLKHFSKIRSLTSAMTCLEGRLDNSLVRLGFFQNLNYSRIAIIRHLVYVNFELCVNIGYIVKDQDLIYVSRFISKYFVDFFWRNNFLKIHEKRPFI